MSTDLELAKQLAATKNYDYVKYQKCWHGASVFFACPKELLGQCYGYPSYILVDAGVARFAKFPDEVESIMSSFRE